MFTGNYWLFVFKLAIPYVAKPAEFLNLSRQRRCVKGKTSGIMYTKCYLMYCVHWLTTIVKQAVSQINFYPRFPFRHLESKRKILFEKTNYPDLNDIITTSKRKKKVLLLSSVVWITIGENDAGCRYVLVTQFHINFYPRFPFRNVQNQQQNNIIKKNIEIKWHNDVKKEKCTFCFFFHKQNVSW